MKFNRIRQVGSVFVCHNRWCIAGGLSSAKIDEEYVSEPSMGQLGLLSHSYAVVYAQRGSQIKSD